METTKMEAKQILTILFLALGLMVYFAKVSEAAPMGTAFTYQGRLIDGNDVADGLYDFQFNLFDDPCVGPLIAGPVNEPNIDIIDGYFTVELDFNDPNAFNGNARWLEIGVRPGDLNDPNVYSSLSPRQKVTPTPYAIYAKSAGGDNDWIISDSNMYSGVSGNVGIGTTVPEKKLDIASDSFTDLGIGLRTNTPGGTSWSINNDVGVFKIVEHASCGPEFGNNTRIAVVGNCIGSPYGGNVGIGTTSPETKLHVYESSSSDVYMSVEASSSNGESGVRLKNTAGGWDVFANDENGDFGIAHALADRVLTIKNSTGNVGIGTTEPNEKLEVNGKIIADNIGSVFTRWGNATAPAGTTLIYSGFAYASFYTHYGHIDPIVVQTGDPGSGGSANAYLYNLAAYGGGDLPPGITPNRCIKGAVCLADAPTVLIWGTHNPPAGWQVLYRGYALGPDFYQEGGSGLICVDCENFDASAVPVSAPTWFYSARIQNPAPGDEELEHKYLKCVVLKK